MTIEQLRQQYAPDKVVRTFQIQWKNAHNDDYDGGREATPDEVARIAAYHEKRVKRALPEAEPAKNGKVYPAKMAGEITPTPDVKPANPKRETAKEIGEVSAKSSRPFWTSFALIFCAISVIAHGVMLSGEALDMFRSPGLFGAIAIFCGNVFALLIATDKDKQGISEIAVFVSAVLDAFAARIHYLYFIKVYRENWDSFAFALIVPFVAWVLVYFFRSILINEN